VIRYFCFLGEGKRTFCIYKGATSPVNYAFQQNNGFFSRSLMKKNTGSMNNNEKTDFNKTKH